MPTMPWLMVGFLVLDFAAPFLAGVALFFLLNARRFAPWKAIAAVTGGYLLYANIVRRIFALFASSFLLLRATEAVAIVFGDETRLRSAQYESTAMQWRLIVYPFVALCVMPTVLAWHLQLVADRHSRWPQSP